MADKKHSLLVGAHMSIAGGFEKALERGESIDCAAIQIFTKSNRQWHAPPIKKEDAETFKTARRGSPIKKINAHSSYLINIGSPKTDVKKRSLAALAIELKRCDQLGIQQLVFHPGAHLGTGEGECLDRIAENIDRVFAKTPGKTMLLIENMAGQGSTVCYEFEQIAYIRKQVKDKGRVGVCFDTCHAFAAGYDFRTAEKYEEMWRDFDRIIGIGRLKVIHMNDSKKEFGSRVDRHEQIGKGKLGTRAFRLLMNDPRFFDVPKILETPKEADMQDDVMNLKKLRSLLEPATRKKLGL